MHDVRNPHFTGPLAFWRKPGLLSGLRFEQTTLGVILVIPLIAVLLGLVAYPMLMAVWYSMLEKSTGIAGRFVGLANYIEILTRDTAILEVFFNTIIYTVSTIILKLIIGLIMALVLNERIVARNFFRGWMLLPWIAPALVVGLTFRWMFDQSGGVINFLLSAIGLIDIPPAWLAEKHLARLAMIATNVWRGFPFFGVTLLAGLQTISVELYEAADMDGATVWQKIRYVTLPALEPVMLVVVILSTIWTFNDFTLVWIMTGGGPGYTTSLFATYAYKLGFEGMRLGYATAVSLIATPLVILFMIALVPRMWRDVE